MRPFIALLLLMSASACNQKTGQAPSPPNTLGTSVSVSEGLGGTPDPGFERAIAMRELVFPDDHGPHPSFATEWWYFTGNLFDDEGRRFGYQLTLFRIGLKPGDAHGDSAWRSNQIYMGHLAVSDVARKKHYSAERFSRAAAGLAGAKVEPITVWLGPWSIRGAGPSEAFPLHLQADGREFEIDLSLAPGDRPVVLQGDRGLSRKSEEPGNASYYYSYTRLPTHGTIKIADTAYRVKGNSWFDREWSSSALAEDQVGWDWFSLQLDDGRDLMFYRLRDRTGQQHPFSQGVLVDSQGVIASLDSKSVTVTPKRFWRSETGARYPVAWRLESELHNLDLSIEASLDQQEMRMAVSYWEGAVDVTGSHRGMGYLELSGYAASRDGE